MLNLRKKLAVSHAITPEFIGYNHTRHILKTLQPSPKEPLGRVGISPWLSENVEHNTVLIHGTPKIMLYSADPDEHLIEIPLIPRSWPPAAQAVGKAPAEFLAPATNGLVGDDDTPLGQKELNVPEAEAEHVIQPNRMADDVSGKAVAIVRIGWRLHPITLAGLRPDCQPRLM
jgi:hypothetical protein